MTEKDRIQLMAGVPCEALAWRNDPRIWKWCRQNGPIASADHKLWQDSLQNNPAIKMFVIYVDGKWTCVGACGLTSIDHINQKAEFSLYIAPEHQKKGYGKQALILLLDHGFSDLNLNRIWGETFFGNPAIKMFETVGLLKEGTHRATYFREGRFIGSYTYAITREQFYDKHPVFCPRRRLLNAICAESSLGGSTESSAKSGSHHPKDNAGGGGKAKTKRTRKSQTKNRRKR